MFSQYTNISIKEVFELLKTSDFGITNSEAEKRYTKLGPNEIKTKGVNVLEIILGQLKSPFFYLLIFAGIISFVIGQKAESLVLLLFVATNILIGFFQEYKAEKAIYLLKKIVPQKVKVIRSGQEIIIDKKFLTQGDIINLVAGDIVPAEARVIDANGFLVDESILTGEAVPQNKTDKPLEKPIDQVYLARNMVFAGTKVVFGIAKAVVVSVGQNTTLGSIAALSQNKREMGSYEKSIYYFCKLTLRMVVSTIILIFFINLIVKGTDNFVDFLIFCVALIVSILPEALPAVVTFALSNGSLKLAKEKVIVKRLSAIEDLGNIEILCSDKTGTLTQNKLSLEKVISSDKNKCLLYGYILTGKINKKAELQNPFDIALMQRLSTEIIEKARNIQIVSQIFFDSNRMKSSFLVQTQKGERILITKGATEYILKSCSKFSGNFTKQEIKEDVAREGIIGKRVLSVAFKKIDHDKTVSEKDENNMTFLGYFVFEDKIKSTTKEAINLAKKLGVKIKIITGDSLEVASFVAVQAGLFATKEQIFSGDMLEKMHPEDFANACEDGIVFARINPETKYKIIKILQKKFVVGFMGDGVNDAPALKIANVGIAVSQATDIAKESADIVLLEKDLKVVIDGIKNGRIIFANINKYIKCALSNNFGNFYSIAVISLFTNFLPMLPVQILLGNLLSDFPLIAVATDSVDIEELQKPKLYQLHLIMPLIVSLGLVSTLFDFIFFLVFYKSSPQIIQTLWFVQTIFTEIFLVYIIRTKHYFVKAKRPSMWLVMLTIIDGVLIIALPFTKFGQELFGFVAPPILGLFVVFGILFLYLVSNEIVKLVYFHFWKPQNSLD